MIGPSICVMCHMTEETTGHLLQGCDWVRASELCGKKGWLSLEFFQLGEYPIQETIEHWAEKAFQNIILNKIWEIFPSFVVWETWKERNSHIFDGRKWSPEEAWMMNHIHIKETSGLKRWGSLDLRAGLEEMMILKN